MANDQREFNILVIEDNPGDFALVEEFLFEQIQVLKLTQAKNCKQATEILSGKNNQFDIILLDLSLPDKTGILLIKEIIELCADTPVIVLTGYSDFFFGVQSLSLGISDYMLKEELTSTSLYKSIVYSSERKKATSALEASEKKYSELFHASPLPMYVFELQSLKFLDVNEAFIYHYGYTREELLCMDLKDIRPCEEIPALEMSLLSDNPDNKNNRLGILKHIKKNGEVIHVDIQSNFIRYKGADAKVTIATDITDRLNYIKAIEQQNEKLREISWMQSHVVRAPLARLMGLIHIVNDIDENNEERRTTFEYILASANELDEVIKQITDKTRIEGDVKLSKCELNR